MSSRSPSVSRPETTPPRKPGARSGNPLGELFRALDRALKGERPPGGAGGPHEPMGGLERPVRVPQIGEPAPEIVGEDIDGVPFKLSDYRGMVVVLKFWG
ncbi:MAG TPA: hypothetical protein EYP14_00135, partial [Planctomycetaceae bacterium]|nr:hypothetical protein [Planctomycetaceae bacterium]